MHDSYLFQLVELRVLEVVECVRLVGLDLAQAHVGDAVAHFADVEKRRTQRRVEEEEVLLEVATRRAGALVADIAVPHIELLPLAIVGEGFQLLESGVQGVLLLPPLQVGEFDFLRGQVVAHALPTDREVFFLVAVGELDNPI